MANATPVHAKKTTAAKKAATVPEEQPEVQPEVSPETEVPTVEDTGSSAPVDPHAPVKAPHHLPMAPGNHYQLPDGTVVRDN